MLIFISTGLLSSGKIIFSDAAALMFFFVETGRKMLEDSTRVNVYNRDRDYTERGKQDVKKNRRRYGCVRNVDTRVPSGSGAVSAARSDPWSRRR
jgi:hypothetical protein